MLSPDEICGIRYSCFRPLKKGVMLVVHDAAIWDIAASQGGYGGGVHALVLSAGADGACTVMNPTNRLFGGGKVLPRFPPKTNKRKNGAYGLWV